MFEEITVILVFLLSQRQRSERISPTILNVTVRSRAKEVQLVTFSLSDFSLNLSDNSSLFFLSVFLLFCQDNTLSPVFHSVRRATTASSASLYERKVVISETQLTFLPKCRKFFCYYILHYLQLKEWWFIKQLSFVILR